MGAWAQVAVCCSCRRVRVPGAVSRCVRCVAGCTGSSTVHDMKSAVAPWRLNYGAPINTMSNETTTETVQADACVNVLKLSEVIAAIHEQRLERDVPGLLIAADNKSVGCVKYNGVTVNKKQLSWLLASEGVTFLLFMAVEGNAEAFRTLGEWYGRSQEFKATRERMEVMYEAVAEEVDEEAEMKGDEA